MPFSQLTVIGCGVFGRAIVDGLSEEALQTYSLVLTHRRANAARELASDYPDALVVEDNEDPRIWAAKSSLPDDGDSHVVVIATQPQFTASVCNQICRGVKDSSSGAARRLTVVTVCPGITLAQLEAWLPPCTPIVRTMPNTPIAVRQGATALFPNQYADGTITAEVQSIFHGMSPVTVVLPQEELLEIVASISGYVNRPLSTLRFLSHVTNMGVWVATVDQRQRTYST
jgi:pyrroline-5-carboxylate reductase